MKSTINKSSNGTPARLVLQSTASGRTPDLDASFKVLLTQAILHIVNTISYRGQVVVRVLNQEMLLHFMELQRGWVQHDVLQANRMAAVRWHVALYDDVGVSDELQVHEEGVNPWDSDPIDSLDCRNRGNSIQQVIEDFNIALPYRFRLKISVCAHSDHQEDCMFRGHIKGARMYLLSGPAPLLRNSIRAGDLVMVLNANYELRSDYGTNKLEKHHHYICGLDSQFETTGLKNVTTMINGISREFVQFSMEGRVLVNDHDLADAIEVDFREIKSVLVEGKKIAQLSIGRAYDFKTNRPYQLNQIALRLSDELVQAQAIDQARIDHVQMVNMRTRSKIFRTATLIGIRNPVASVELVMRAVNQAIGENPPEAEFKYDVTDYAIQSAKDALSQSSIWTSEMLAVATAAQPLAFENKIMADNLNAAWEQGRDYSYQKMKRGIGHFLGNQAISGIYDATHSLTHAIMAVPVVGKTCDRVDSALTSGFGAVHAYFFGNEPKEE